MTAAPRGVAMTVAVAVLLLVGLIPIEVSAGLASIAEAAAAGPSSAFQNAPSPCPPPKGGRVLIPPPLAGGGRGRGKADDDAALELFPPSRSPRTNTLTHAEPFDRAVHYAQAKSQSDSSQRYQWLFGRQEEEPAQKVEGTTLLEEFDKEVKQARKLYISGEVDKSILRYRTAIDRLETLVDAVPSGHRLLPELARRFQVFEELATKILGPVDSKPKEELAGEIFFLMEKRRTCGIQVILKKAGPVHFFDVPAGLLKEEGDILAQLAVLQSEGPGTGARKKEQALRSKLATVRDSLATSSQRYALLRKGAIMPLAELRRDLLRQGEMILDFNLFRDRLVVGFITTDKAVYRQVAANRSEIDKGVFNLQQKLREFTFSGRSTFMGHAWKEPCRRLYRSLLGKLPPVPDDASLIFVVPDRSLWYLPFSVLLDAEDRPFGGDRLLSVIPSASMLRMIRSAALKDGGASGSSGLAIFESLPLATDEAQGTDQPPTSSRKKKSDKTSEGERIEQIILSTAVYPRPSEIVLKLQKVFAKADVWIGPAATINHLLENKDRVADITLMAVPFFMTDAVTAERQPCLFFSPDKKGTRRFGAVRLFEAPFGTRLAAFPNSWFDVPDKEAPLAEGPVLLSTALMYAGTSMALVNYSNPDWGNEDPFLLGVLEKAARGATPGQALSEYGRKMPAGLESSFSGKPPAWAGWMLLGDPAQ